jgi:hypothetical protein
MNNKYYCYQRGCQEMQGEQGNNNIVKKKLKEEFE